MSQKVLNTKILVRRGRYDAWSDSTVLLAGELAIVEFPTGQVFTTTNNATIEPPPTCLMKVGDGVTQFGDLPYINAIAADVHAWAKNSVFNLATAMGNDTSNANYTATVNKIRDIAGGAEQDTIYRFAAIYDQTDNTKIVGYKLQQADGTGNVANYTDSNWSDVSGSPTITIPDATADLSSLGVRMTAVENRFGDLGTVTENSTTRNKTVKEYVDGATGTIDSTISTLAGRVTTAEGTLTTLTGSGTGSVTKTVNDAIAAQATLDAAAYAGKSYEDKVDTLIGSDTGKSVREIAALELAAQLIPNNADESLDTLQEIAAWIQSHPDDAAALNTKLTLGTHTVSDGEGGTETVQYDTVKDYVEAYVAAQIASGTSGLASSSDLTTLAGRVTDAEGDIDTLQTSMTTAEGDIDALEAKVNLTTGQTVTGLIATAKSEAIAAAGTATTTALGELDYTIAAGTGKVLTGFQIADGKLVANSTTTANISAVGSSGNPADLVQTTGDYLLLYGGEANGTYTKTVYGDFITTS